MVAAPHTSNMDFPLAMLCFFAMGIPVRFTIKKEWMRFPFNLVIGPLGGIAIDRSPRQPGEQRRSMTEAMIDLFHQRKELVVLVTPEGTRSRNEKWKTGFYYVALGAKVPLALGYLDYEKKEAGVGMLFEPTGNIEADMQIIMDFYRDKKGRYPEKFSTDKTYDKRAVHTSGQ
ncbi:MAG: 1-acyl-sn-glycerol-3-phosphate acyltransferase [Chitinophagales bacterium]|nr:1-acyl-sn-glycerol-3-phosphate acyltransferase [Chitinophagales bacterium]MDW8273976.1 1-acyl-sn-glycerol-3-phosphate acyltransferase [Chitinophagales bacterium]